MPHFDALAGGKTQTLRSVWGIVGTYVLVAGFWIFFSDRLLGALVPERELVNWSILKGLTFVFVTGTMLCVLISRLTSKIWRASNSSAASERKFRALFEEVTDGIVVIELESKSFYLGNNAFCRMLGYREVELRHLTVADIHPPEAMPRVMGDFEQITEGMATATSNLPVKRKDGTVFYADINATGIELDCRQYVIGVFRDITEQKRVEGDLKMAKEAAEAANHAKDEFIAVLSHELRTPLTPALAVVTALQADVELPADARVDLEVVRRNLEMESKLIDDLLDVTRMSRGKIELSCEKVNIHACLERAVDICHGEIEAKGLEVSQQLEAVRHEVCADPARLQQVLWTLVKNAVKFTPEGGRISLRSVQTGEGGRVRIEIADSGIGIEPETLARLFHPFEQGEQTRNRRFGGLGLGLCLAKSLVELHEGSLTVASDGKDKGAVFTVELPVLDGAPEPLVAPPAPSALRLPRILLVDDHADTLQIFRRLLQKWGYDVVTAVSVESALQAAAGQKFDGLLSDLGLPDGSGREIMAEVKARYGLRGIALSGFGAENDFRSSLAAGFDEHFVKPVSFAVLKAALQRMTDAPPCSGCGQSSNR